MPRSTPEDGQVDLSVAIIIARDRNVSGLAKCGKYAAARKVAQPRAICEADDVGVSVTVIISRNMCRSRVIYDGESTAASENVPGAVFACTKHADVGFPISVVVGDHRYVTYNAPRNARKHKSIAV